MILADKLIRLRKRIGWSQEELADKMGVSRQAVSKWEGAQTVPDLEKILRLADLFGVTTDYLLKDEIEDEIFTDSRADDPVRRVTMEEANAYLDSRPRAARCMALGVWLCMVSVIPLILLCGLSDAGRMGEGIAVGIGLGWLFLLVAAAVVLFVREYFRNEPYRFLDRPGFGLAYGVEGLVRDRAAKARSRYIRRYVTGIVLCILSPLPLVILSLMTENELIILGMVCVLIALVSAAVVLFILEGVPRAGMDRLLKEGDYAPEKRQNETLAEVYWGVVTAVYLGWSFLSNDWGITWIVWPVAAVLYPLVNLIANRLSGRTGSDKKE